METTKSYCNRCVGERNHAVVHSIAGEGGNNEEDRYWWQVRYDTLKCLGCDMVSLRREYTDSDTRDREGNDIPTFTYFPPAVFRREPEWLHHFVIQHMGDEGKEFMIGLIRELYVCLQNDLRRAAAMAVRALLEHVMIDKVGDRGSFANNVARFEGDGFISTKQRDFLKAALEAGHATMHRAYLPSKDDLINLVNIAESVIESAYVNEGRAAALRMRVPQRKS